MIPDSLFMIQKVCRILILCSIVLMCFALGYVGYANIRDWNSLIVEYHFKDDARVYGLYPPDRVSKLYTSQVGETYSPSPPFAKGGIKGGFQELVASPVYLDIRYWQTFKKAKVEILYEKDLGVDFQIGYKVGKDFQWKLFSILEERILTDFAMAKNVRQAVMEINLAGEYIPRNNVHRWIFSSTNVQDLGKAIRIYGIKFTFTK